jgi:pimeloyl-ACP methyl ester carboxylesterase
MIAVTLSRTLQLGILMIAALIGQLGVAQTYQDRKIDIGGCRLHILEAGSGAPVVVFESGLGEPVATWKDVQPEVARFTRTISYDRAGLGQSDPSPHPRTMTALAVDLHSVLHAAKIPPPYVLVGHSLGGAIVQVFADTYPKEVAGLVLVDPAESKLEDRLHSRMPAEEWSAREKLIDGFRPKAPATLVAEMDAEMNASNNSTPTMDKVSLPRVPLILFTGTQKNPSFPGNPLEQDLKLELHNARLEKIPGGKHILVPNSRHYIQNDAPQLVIDAIHDIVSGRTSKLAHAPLQDLERRLPDSAGSTDEGDPIHASLPAPSF